MIEERNTEEFRHQQRRIRFRDPPHGLHRVSQFRSRT
jgi:hypothetical protein